MVKRFFVLIFLVLVIWGYSDSAWIKLEPWFKNKVIDLHEYIDTWLEQAPLAPDLSSLLPPPEQPKPAPGSSVVKMPPPPVSGPKVSAAEIAQIERYVVELVNQDRQRAGLQPVSWDETASRAARRHVQEEADNGFISHWGMDGVKPQLRYTRAGGRDAVDENESVTLWPEGGFSGVSKDSLAKIVAEHEQSMVNEQPPNDGHRQNILDPHHTGVGIAIAVGRSGVAMAQEFTNHYTEMQPVPLTAAPGATISLAGRVLAGYQVTGVYAIWEESPHPLSKEQLSQTGSYSDPPWDNLHFWAKPNGRGYYIMAGGKRISAANLSVDKQGNFTLKVPLTQTHALDYVSVEVAPVNNRNDRFYAAQFVIEH